VEIGEASPLLHAPLLRAIDGGLTAAGHTSDDHGELSLPGLQTVGGSVALGGALDGLHADQLISIGGGLDVVFAVFARPSLVLPALHSIAGNLTARGGGIKTLDLPQLTQLGGGIKLFGLSLTQFTAPSLTELPGDIDILFGALTKIDLSALTTSGGIRITAPGLATLAMPALRVIHPPNHSGGITGFELDSTGLEAIDLASLQSMTGRFQILTAPALHSLQLPELTATQALWLLDCPMLETVQAPKLASLPVLTLQNTGVKTLELGALVTASTISIRGAALTDLSGLRSLASVASLHLENIAGLQDLRGLAALRTVTTLELVGNPALTSLDGLEPLSESMFKLTISDNPALTSIAGLRNVTHMVGPVLFSGDSALADLALPALTRISGTLSIIDLDALTTLAGLDALTFVGGAIAITDNDNLPPDVIAAFKTRLDH
jgi:hypothetical protein